MTPMMLRGALQAVLTITLLATGVCAQDRAVSVTTLNTDPIWRASVFWTNPPLSTTDSDFVQQLNQTGLNCYLGSGATGSHCYTSSLSGSLTILNDFASQNFTTL